MLLERKRSTASHRATLEYVVRHARATDLPQLEWFGEYSDLRLVEAAAWAHVRDGTLLFFVADVNGFPVGQIKIALRHDEDVKANGVESGYLYALRVFRPFQRLGIGTALIGHGEDFLRERGFSWATIAVDRQNTDARRLYERLGYMRVREQRRSWSYQTPAGRRKRVEVNEVLLRKALANAQASSR